ncbi:uncharacterized protein [Diadema setosum]|uniref:uncharacterized protein n=1 Tax=Diadema setosum TaxID=31175 RepID=UPI003B39FB57
MTEERRFYDLVPNYEVEGENDEKDSQAIPPISTFAKRSGSGNEEFPSPPSRFYRSESNSQGMSQLEDNNNSNGNSPEELTPVTQANDTTTTARPNQTEGETVILLQRAHSQLQQQQPQDIVLQQQQQQQQQQLQQYNASMAALQHANHQVLVTATTPGNGVLTSQVMPGVTVPTSAIHGGMPMQGHLIPFISANGSTAPQAQSVLSHAPEQMMQYPSTAVQLAAMAAGGQTTTTSRAASTAQSSVIQVNETMNPTILPHNVNLQQHVQQHLQQHGLKNGKELPPTPPGEARLLAVSADEKDDEDSERRKNLANLLPPPSHLNPQPIQATSATARPGLPAHLVQYNASQAAPYGGPAPSNFAHGPVSTPGLIAPGTYGNIQVVSPLQGPPGTMAQPVAPQQALLGDQPNQMMMPPGPGGLDMQTAVGGEHHVPGPSIARRPGQPTKRRGNKRTIPVEEKDERYFERRKRNNQAAKRSRDARKTREEQVGQRANYLEKENEILRAQLNTLRDEANSLRLLLAQRPPVAQMPPSGPSPM